MPPTESEPTGVDLARQMLAAARARARQTGAGPAHKPRRRVSRTRAIDTARDPQSLGNVLDRLAETYGWNKPSDGARVIVRWFELAPEAAGLAAPERYDAETRTLFLRPVSPAAATQLRLTAPRLAATLNERTGTDTVATVRVLPPGRPRTTEPDHPGGEPVPERPTAAPGQPGGPPIRTRDDASPGLQAAQHLLAELREANSHPERKRPELPPPVLREPESAFTEALAFTQELAEQADRLEDPHARALARARAEKAGRAPAVPRAFDRTA
ncbi:DciA family protein [Actinacidiphila acididurans]|uniref:DUF721 domain-containing protein n=1 Tax=Actinacidiphila acididurans TaxID=2784346 RepID=A0ABS2U3W2_9ACTN|nr:DUF721 domain-containing protein [Actinacidiphila acididurans]MBM9510027.1 DUF721 domain-containing protein [Actinacidiphila acididurans]